jgi:uncharacterized protein
MKKNSIAEKYDKLKQAVKEKNKVLIAFSGGVDSSVVAKVAHDILGMNAVAVTISSETLPKKELEDAKKIASEIGIRHKIVYSSALKNKNFMKNPRDRCYLCKKDEIETLRTIAKDENIKCIADGVVRSDFNEHRPGIKAADEYNVWHPLSEQSFSKKEVRNLARKLGLSIYNKPSNACLSSRIPYHEKITKEKLKRIETAENFIFSLGFKQVRVRCHEALARIEVTKNEIEKILESKSKIVRKLRKIGFKYVTLDLEGYRSGSMDEIL